MDSNFGFVKGACKVSSSTTKLYGSSCGTDFGSSEIAGPVVDWMDGPKFGSMQLLCKALDETKMVVRAAILPVACRTCRTTSEMK